MVKNHFLFFIWPRGQMSNAGHNFMSTDGQWADLKLKPCVYFVIQRGIFKSLKSHMNSFVFILIWFAYYKCEKECFLRSRLLILVFKFLSAKGHNVFIRISFVIIQHPCKVFSGCFYSNIMIVM